MPVSSLLNLSERFNEVVALEFNLACTARLKLYDEERESRMLEALGLNSFTQALGAAKITPKVSVSTVKEGTF